MAEKPTILNQPPDEVVKLFVDKLADVLVQKMPQFQAQGGLSGAPSGRGSASVPPPRSQGSPQSSASVPQSAGGGTGGGGVSYDRQEGGIYTVGASGEASPSSSRPPGARPDSGSDEEINEIIAKQAGGLSVQNGTMDEKRRWARHWKKKQGPEGGMLPTYFGGKINWQQAATGSTGVGDIMQRGFSKGAPLGLSKFKGFKQGGVMSGLGAGMSKWGGIAEDNALGIEAVRSGLRRAGAESSKLDQYGLSLGAVQGEGGGTVGPMRLPFLNPAARKGMGAIVDSKISGALTPGLSSEDDLQLKGSLAQQGWYDGTADADALLGKGYGKNKGGMRELISYDPGLNNPQTDQMRDQVARFGGDMAQFFETMKGVRDAAMGANVGLEQFEQGMISAGEASIATGGSMQQGMDNALSFTAATGLPPEVMVQLQQNPYVQGRTYQDTGVIPQMQGALGEEVRQQSTINSVDEMWGNVGNFPRKVIRDDDGNILDIMSGDTQKAAMVGEALGIKAQAVEKMMTDDDYKAGVMVPAKAKGAISSFQESMRLGAKGNKRGTYKFAEEGIKQTNSMIRNMSRATDEEGEALYDEKDIENVKNAGKSVEGLDLAEDDMGIDDGEADNISAWLERKKIMKGDMDSREHVRAALEDNPRLKVQYKKEHVAEFASGIETKARKKMKDDKDVNSGGTIELGVQAQKYFQFMDTNYQSKLEANAGGASTNYPSSQDPLRR